MDGANILEKMVEIMNQIDAHGGVASEQERADALALKEPVEAWVDWANKPGSIDHLLYTWHLRRALAKVWKALLPYVE